MTYPSAPLQLSHYTRRNPYRVALDNGLIYVTYQSNGLGILKMGKEPEVSSNLPTSITSSTLPKGASIDFGLLIGFFGIVFVCIIKRRQCKVKNKA